MSYDQIPETELNIFKHLPDIKVVFDVGSRDDTDYIKLKPKIEFHAFEPHPGFFDNLKTEIGERPNTYLNNYGLGDEEKMEYYSAARQGFIDGDETFAKPDESSKYQIRTLDQYIDEHNIERIDFLKVDTEGYDLKVLLGGRNALKITRFVQYEYWNNKLQFHELLEHDWYMMYIGGRTVICAQKSLGLQPYFK